MESSVRPLAERLQEALGTSYEIGEELPGGGVSRLFAYARLGDTSRAGAIAARLETPPLKPNSYSALAKVQLGLGRRDQAIAALERAVQRHEPFFASEPLGGPSFAELAGDPRLLALRKRIGLSGGR